MTTKLVKLEIEFEGKPVTTFRYHERPAWLAREIGVALEYADGGKSLVAMLTRDWADELQEGSDFTRIEGAELSDLKALLALGEESSPSRIPSVIILLKKDHSHPCPACGNSRKFNAQSRQSAEDCCEVWVVCGECGYDPTEMNTGYRVESIWGGTSDDYEIANAIQAWGEAIEAMKEKKE